jgi:hypothetical protein
VYEATKPKEKKVKSKPSEVEKEKERALRKEAMRLSEMIDPHFVPGKPGAVGRQRAAEPPQNSPEIVWRDTSEDGDMWDR